MPGNDNEEDDEEVDSGTPFADGAEDLPEIVAAENHNTGGTANNSQNQNYRIYSHSGKYWHTPKDFELPREQMRLENSWRLWVEAYLATK